MLKMRLNLQFFASGTITGNVASSSSGTKLQMKVDWSYVEDVSTGDFTFTTKLYGRRADSLTGGTSGRKWSGSVQVGDNTAHTFDDMGSSWADKEISTSWVLFKTYTDTITLEAGETKKITISGSLTGCSGSSLAGIESSGSGTVTITATATEDTNTKIKIKVNGQYIDGELYIKNNSSWTQNTTLYLKVDNAWKEVV